MSSLETWPHELTDFALESKDGEVLRCHKARLIENSEYFEGMLRHKVRETDESKMVVPDYDGVTVASFLEWIYAAVFGEDVVKKLKQVAEPGEFVSQRRFDEKKFTPELLKMAHIYQMSDLQSDYLEQTISKENAAEAWKAAGISGSQKLREKALTIMARNHKEGEEIPGLKDQAIDLEEIMDWFANHATIKGEEGALGADQFHVKVKFNSDIMMFFVCPDCEKVASLKTKIAQRIQRPEDTFWLLGAEGWLEECTRDTFTLTQSDIFNGECLEVQLIQ